MAPSRRSPGGTTTSVDTNRLVDPTAPLANQEAEATQGEMRPVPSVKHWRVDIDIDEHPE
jgi:hypothetical protein